MSIKNYYHPVFRYFRMLCGLMASGVATEGFQAMLGIGLTDPPTKAYDFDGECSLALTSTVEDATGIVGSRERCSERAREGLLKVAGSVKFHPSLADLEGAGGLMQWPLGGTPSGGNYPLSDTLSSRVVVIDKVTSVNHYPGVVCNKAVFSGSEGGLINLALDLIGTTEVVNAAGSFPTSTATLNLGKPLMFYDAALVVAGVTLTPKSFTLTIDNMIDAKFYNSQSATALIPKDRKTTFSCLVPNNSISAALYLQGVNSASASLALSYGSGTMTFSMGVLQIPPKGQTLPGRDEITLTLEGDVRSSGLGTGGYVPSLLVTLPS